jgi:hypothetical protein
VLEQVVERAGSTSAQNRSGEGSQRGARPPGPPSHVPVRSMALGVHGRCGVPELPGKRSGGLCEEGGVPHTPDRPVDIASLFPELAGQERPTVRLHPRRGRPGPWDSSIGGPLLWPAAEPWPRCDAPDRHIIDAPIGTGVVGHTITRLTRDPRRITAPMVAVAQLFARDVPGLPVPPGRRRVPAAVVPNVVPRARLRAADPGALAECSA